MYPEPFDVEGQHVRKDAGQDRSSREENKADDRRDVADHDHQRVESIDTFRVTDHNYVQVNSNEFLLPGF